MTRDTLREKWRLKAVEAAQADDRASRAKEGKPIFLDQLVETLIEQAEEKGEKLAQSKAERIARTSDAYKGYLRKMHDARHAADLLRIEAELWTWAEELRHARRAGVHARNTSTCGDYGGCPFIPLCVGDPDAMSLFQVRPEREPDVTTTAQELAA